MASHRAPQPKKRVRKMKLKKGDTVQVITGATADRGGDRGKTGKVIQVFPQTSRVLVEGINQVTKHRRVTPTSAGASSGGIEVVEAPMHISNVMLVDPETSQPTRVGYRSEDVERDGRTRTTRVRVARRSGKDV